MTDRFMADSAVQERYGFTSSDTFDGKFSKVSIEGLLFYVVAFGIWVLEKLFDTHKEEVSTMLADLTPTPHAGTVTGCCRWCPAARQNRR